MRAKKLRSLLPVMIFFAMALGLSAWLWISSNNKAVSLRKQKEDLELSQATSRSKLMRSDADKALILTHLAAYQQLGQRGVTEGGNRLAWLEAVQEANRAARLYGMQYALEAATPVPESADLERTLMKLRMPLLTESDLTVFLTALAAKETGLFWTKSCTLIRTGSLQPAMTNQPGLESVCELYWYNVKKTGGS